MGILDVVLIILWATTIFDGVFGIVKGYFYREKEKVNKHDPVAYRKWIRLSGVFLILCGVINIILCILDAFADAFNFKYVIFIVITVAVVIAAISVLYARIVKPADKALGITSEFDEILKKDK